MFSVVKYELDRESHTLRQMTGRRKMRLSAGEFRPVNNPNYPVIKRGHWTEVPYEEHIKKIEVSKLKKYVDEFRSSSKSIDKCNIPSRLYTNRATKMRILVYVNGQTPDKAKYFNESSFESLNEAVKNEFMLNKSIKYFFTQTGQIITRFEELTRDQIICASTGREFISPNNANRDIEIKASWARKRREGWDPDSLVLHKRPIKNLAINVDPFSPSNNKNHLPSKLAINVTESFYDLSSYL